MNSSQSRWICPLACAMTFSLLTSASLWAAGGTSIVARSGQKAAVSAGWPQGVGDLVNHPARTTGWNSWFSEWPNDVNQYALEIKTMEELNRLIQELASVKSDMLQIRLSYLKEPKSLGWVTQVPKGNGIPVIFSIGDQSRIDQWYKRVRKPFGQMVFVATPVAVPPTLTIFVQSEVVQLDKLSIPAGIAVTKGYVPTVFHRSNTTIELKREKEAREKAKTAPNKSPAENLEAKARESFDAIQTFLEQRTEQSQAANKN